MAVLNTVKSFLKAKNIDVPNDWITACIDWVISDTPGLNTSNTRAVTEKVYEQWLFSDLTQIGTCCLPVGLSQQRVTTISGYFTVQVNQVRDVGHAAYSQLQKVQKADTENASVTAENKYQAAWEPKASRMLLMQITDGTSVVRGMEYRTIPCLTPNLKPGTKLLLSGTITSRRGTLMLKRGHVEVMGGEVESLAIPNALENVLSRCLGIEETEHPREYEEMVTTQVTPSQVSQYYPSQINATPHSHPATRGHQVVESRPGGVPSAPHNQNLDEMEDEDFLNADIEAVLSQIEKQASPSPRPAQNTSLGSSSREGFVSAWGPGGGGSGAVSSNSNVIDDGINEMDIDDDIFNCDFDEELSLPAEAQMPRQQLLTKSTVKSGNNPPGSSTGSFTQSSNFPPNTQPPMSQSAQQNKPNTLAFVRPSIPKVPYPSRPAQSTSQAIVKPKTHQSTLNNFVHKLSTKNSHDDNVSTLINQSDGSSGMKFEAGKVGALAQFSRQPRGLGGGLGQAIQPVQRSVTEKVKEDPPFNYLCLLPQTPSDTQDVVVKGFIMTLLSRLEQVDGQWRLRVLINDGTASREVGIASEVLEKLIGLSVEELGWRKAKAKTNPELKAQITKSVVGCQQKLISLCCLLHLRLSPSLPSPTLTAISPVTGGHARQLALRGVPDL